MDKAMHDLKQQTPRVTRVVTTGIRYTVNTSRVYSRSQLYMQKAG